MDKLIDSIIEVLKRNNSLTEDEEIVRFGLEVMIEKSIFIVIIMMLGLLMGCFFECAVFTVCFALLREYCGGYHAETKNKCFVLSILTQIVAFSVIKITIAFPTIAIPIYIISSISIVYIFIFSPVDTLNKRLDTKEIQVYGKKSRQITVGLSVVAMFLWVLKLSNLSVAIVMGIVIETYLMVLGRNKKMRNGDDYEQ